MEIVEELKKYSNENVIVQRVVPKPVMGTGAREFIDKKIFFEADDTIYMWVTSTPDKIYPTNSKYTRATSLVGMNKIGKR